MMKFVNRVFCIYLQVQIFVHLISSVYIHSPAEEGIGLNGNTIETLRRGQARLYYDTHLAGAFEDFNINLEEDDWTDCQNLNSTVAGHVRSIDSYGTCVQLFSQINCMGQRIDILGSHQYESHNNLKNFARFPIYSIGQCYSRPERKEEYPKEMYKAILENKRDNDGTEERMDSLKERIDELEDELEHLELRTLGTAYSDLEERWDTCGGLINLQKGAELTYQNLGRNDSSTEEGEDLQEETCVWVISGKKGGPMSFTLRELKASNITGSTGHLSIHREYTNKYPISRLLTSQDLKKEVRLYVPSALLVATSIKGQGFKLRILDGGSQTGSMYGDYGASLSRSVVTAVFLGGSSLITSKNESKFLLITNGTTYSHPPFKGEQYMSHERRHIVIKPIPKKRIHLAIDFVDTEDNGDYLNVFRYSTSDQKLNFVHRYTGSLGLMDNVTIDGDEDELFFLYFHSDGSIEYRGFEIFYSYLNSTDDNQPKRMEQQRPFLGCGGLVRLPNYTEIVYQNSRTDSLQNPYEESCIWLVSATYGGPISVKLDDDRFTSKDFALNSNQTASLSIQTKFTDEASATARQIFNEDLGKEIFLDDTTTIIIFKSTEYGQGFRIKLKDLMRSRWRVNLSPPNVTFIQFKSENVYQIAYPSTGNYSSGEKNYFILEPSHQTQILLSLDFVDTFSSSDFVSIFKFTKRDSKFQFTGRFTGRLGQLDNSSNPAVFEGQVNEPIFIYFRTNSYMHGRGIKFSYAYQSIDKKGESKNEYPWASLLKQNFTHRRVEIIEECGGFVALDTEKVLTIKNNNSHEDTCIWVITAVHGGVIGLTLQKNFNGSSLSVLTSDFVTTQNSSMIRPKFITSDDFNVELVHEENSAILIFSKSQGSTFQNVRLCLRELGQSKGLGPFDSTKSTINGSLIRLAPGSKGNFSYPPQPVKKYENSEKRFILLYPAAAQNISVNIHFIDMDDNYDFLSIFKFSYVQKTFEYLRRFTGYVGDIYTNSIQGDEGPLVVYFQSGRYTAGKGFKFSYDSTRSSLGPSIGHSSAACGALVPIDSLVNFFYQNFGQPDNSSLVSDEQVDDSTTCIWVIAPSKQGRLKFHLKEFNFGEPNNNSSKSALSLQGNFQDTSNTTIRFIQKEDLERDIILQNETSVLLIAHSKRGQNFHIQIEIEIDNSNVTELERTMSTSTTHSPLYSANILDESPSRFWPGLTFSYPESVDYSSLERRHIIIKAKPGTRISLTMTYLDTEKNHDFLNIFKYSKEEHKLVFLRQYSGSLGNFMYYTPKIHGDENQPIFLYFESDETVQRHGFRFVYSYEMLSVLNQTESTNYNSSSTIIMGYDTTDYNYHDNNGDNVSHIDDKKLEWNGTSTLHDVWLKFASVSQNLKEEMNQKFQRAKETPGWQLILLIIVSFLSSCTSICFCSYFVWQINQKRKSQAAIKKTVTYARTGTREAVLLGDQDEDTVL